ncbi:hypothetical protein GCM10028820_20590 [Tessaracoccus terricola]
MKRILSLLAISGLLAAGGAAVAHADPAAPTQAGLVLHVAPGGSDSAPGTQEEPLLTLEGARDAIREIRASEGLPDGGITVDLHEGTYPRTSSFELGEQDSGTADAPITYRSHPGETAHISGGVQLARDEFQQVTDAAVLDRIIEESARGKVLGIDLAAAGVTDLGEVSRHGYWKANDVSTTPPMELYVGGQGMTLARWPNTGTVRMGEILDAGPTVKDPDLQERGGTFKYNYDRPQYWTEADDVWLDGIFGYSWEWSYNKIANIDTEARTITLAYGEMSGLMTTWFEDFHFAENLLEELDAPGEYFIDRGTGMLYFIPNTAFALGEEDITATVLDEPMVRLTEASHVNFDDLVLEYGRATAAVVLGGSNVTFSNSDIQNFADGGVLINSPGRYTYDGIPVNRGGHDHAVVNSHLRHIGGVPVVLQGGNEETLEPGNNRVENSHIHDFAYYHKAYNPGVMFAGVGNIGRHNEIHDAPHPGIIVHGNDHLIEGNEIYDICKTFQDLGAIYMNAGNTPQQRGTVIRGNYFHDTGVGRLGVEGIYPDNLTMGLTIENNLFVRMGNAAIKSGSGDRITTTNNVFVDTHVPYDNYEMWMGDGPGNTVDTKYLPGWLELFEENNGFVDTPYAERYPELLGFLDENHYYPELNFFERNLVWNPTMNRSGDVNGQGARDVHDLMNYTDNWVADQDPGFVDWQNDDFTLRDDAPAFEHIPGLEALDFANMGTVGKVGQSNSPDSIALVGLKFPSSTLTIDMGKRAAFAAEVLPWNATLQAVTYASSDPAVATIDADGTVEALTPGETTLRVTSTADPTITDEAVLVVADGDGIMYFTDFEQGGNGWGTDPYRSIVADDDGNHWYRIRGGANSQLDRQFGEYELEFDVRTTDDIPEGAVMLIYDRSGGTPAGHIEYRASAAGSRWTIYDGVWGTVNRADATAATQLQPGTTHHIRMVVSGSSISVFIDDELAVDGANPMPAKTGKVGFYVNNFTHLDFDNVSFGILSVPVEGIELNASEAQLEPGERRQFEARITPADATHHKVTWTSDNPDVATVDASGMVQAVAPGIAVVTVTSAAFPELSASATVAVAEVEHPVIELGAQLTEAAGWPQDPAVDFDEGHVRISQEGVRGYSAEQFGSGLLKFKADFGAFDGGWYGFSVRSDAASKPTWEGGNKGYLVVIKEDQIEFQSWKPGQTMMDIIPNTVIAPGSEHEIEFGAVAVDGGNRLVLRVDGVTVWSGMDADSERNVAAEGYFNVYHYGRTNSISLSPVQEDDGAVAPPSRATLSNTSGWAHGLHDGNYDVVMNLWWGVPGSSLRLYENGVLLETVPLTVDGSGQQQARVAVAGRPNGTYVYTGELVNSKGVTATSSTTVKVQHAAPAAPVVSHDNWDRDGSFTATANLWWGTNATSYRFELDGVAVADGQLTAASPAAQRASVQLDGVAPGQHQLVAVFVNEFGETASKPVTVTVA